MDCTKPGCSCSVWERPLHTSAASTSIDLWMWLQSLTPCSRSQTLPQQATVQVWHSALRQPTRAGIASNASVAQHTRLDGCDELMCVSSKTEMKGRNSFNLMEYALQDQADISQMTASKDRAPGPAQPRPPGSPP